MFYRFPLLKAFFSASPAMPKNIMSFCPRKMCVCIYIYLLINFRKLYFKIYEYFRSNAPQSVNLPTSARSGKKIGMLPVTFGAKWLVVKILSILNLILNITSGQVFHTLEISILGFRIGRWGMGGG